MEGITADFDGAKRRAARDLGQDPGRNLPDNLEVHRAVADYLALFGGAAHAERLLEKRRAALAMMERLDGFRPRLAGPVLYGTAPAHAPVNLHLFAPEVEAVSRLLLERRVPYRLTDAPFRFRRGNAPERVSVFELDYDEECFELAVFPDEGSGRHPLSPIDGRPMRRASSRALEALIASREVFCAATSDPAF